MSEDSNTPKIETTRDGSHTLYSHQFEQHYHNPNGAVAESKHNFFEVNGLYDALTNSERNEITILEVGFGTGLNLILLADYLRHHNLQSNVTYHSIEAYPVDAETSAGFNFSEHLHHPEVADLLPEIFGSLTPGDNRVDIPPSVEAHIFCGLFNDFAAPSLQADYIFHDAFSPDVNPELWTAGTFRKLHDLSASDALLTTYSAASAAKGAMAAADWHLAKTRGALGKREMTVASPNPEALAAYDPVDTKRLKQRYEEGDFE